MATKRENMKKLIDERDRLLKDIEALKNRVGGLDLALSLLQHDAGDGLRRAGVPSSSVPVKTIVLDLLKEVGTVGLDADGAATLAARRGITLHRGSAASALSRLKKEGIAAYDQKRYRLVEYARLALVKNG